MQSQLGEVFKSLVYCDYPDSWPGLLEAVYGHLTSGVSPRWAWPSSNTTGAAVMCTRPFVERGVERVCV